MTPPIRAQDPQKSTASIPLNNGSKETSKDSVLSIKNPKAKSPIDLSTKNPWIAYLSTILLPGSGQFYCNNIVQGLVHLSLHHATIFSWVFLHHFQYTQYYLGFGLSNLLLSFITVWMELNLSKWQPARKRSFEKKNRPESASNVPTEESIKENQGKKDKVRFSLRTKIFLLVLLLIVGLLFAVYIQTEREIRKSLTNQIKNKGDAITYQIAAGAGSILTNMKLRAEIEGNTLSLFDFKLSLVDLISKRDHPLDVVYSLIDNEQGITVIDSEDALIPEERKEERKEGKPYSPPQNVFAFKDLHEVKYALSKYFNLLTKDRIKNGEQPATVEQEIMQESFFNNHIMELEQACLDIHRRIFDEMVESWRKEQRELATTREAERKKQREEMLTMSMSEESITQLLDETLPIPKKQEELQYIPINNITPLLYRSYTMILDDWESYKSYLYNMRVTLFEIILDYRTRFEDLKFPHPLKPDSYNISTWVWDQFLTIQNIGPFYEEEVASFTSKVLERLDAIDAQLHDETAAKTIIPTFQEPYEQFKQSITALMIPLERYVTPGKSLVQSFERGSGVDQETILDVSYPISNLNDFRKGIIRNFQGEVHIGISLKNINFTISDVQTRLSYTAYIVIAVATILSFLLAMLIVVPIRRIVAAMQKIKGGDLNVNVPTTSRDEIGLLAKNFNEMASGLREKERIRSIMDKAVSKQIAEEMLKGEIKLGGETKIISVFFSDIRSFTSISENLSPEILIAFLNEYLSIMSSIIIKNRGVVDKYIGDGIMALFGAPIPILDDDGNYYDADAAVIAALQMGNALNEYNKRRSKQGQREIMIGIGINTGPVVAGNMGSEERMNYTVLGDNVNTASRLEAATKAYKVTNIISESTFEAINNKHLFYFRELDLLRVVGKVKPIRVYEVMGFREEIPEI